VEQVHGGESVMKRFRNKPLGRQLIEKTIDELLIKEARLAREKAEHLPPGEERQLIEKAIDELLIKAARLAREKAEQFEPPPN
jgi:hypothetical protein